MNLYWALQSKSLAVLSHSFTKPETRSFLIKQYSVLYRCTNWTDRPWPIYSSGSLAACSRAWRSSGFCAFLKNWKTAAQTLTFFSLHPPRSESFDLNFDHAPHWVGRDAQALVSCWRATSSWCHPRTCRQLPFGTSGPHEQTSKMARCTVRYHWSFWSEFFKMKTSHWMENGSFSQPPCTEILKSVTLRLFRLTCRHNRRYSIRATNYGKQLATKAFRAFFLPPSSTLPFLGHVHIKQSQTNRETTSC